MDLKKWPVVILACLLLCLLLCSCVGAGLGDWSYPLPNSYAIWRVNSQCIVFGKESGHSLSNDVDSYIFAFCCNERYVGLKRLEERPLPDAPVSADSAEFYLVDTQTEQIVGPMSERAYREKLDALGINDLCDWIDTYPAPDGAVFSR